MKQLFLVFAVVAGVLIVPLAAHAALSDGLRAYWSMDEASGVRADATGNGNDLTPLNAVGSGTGFSGNAAIFGDIFSRFTDNGVLTKPGFTLNNESFTVAFWAGKWILSTTDFNAAYGFYVTDENENAIEADVEYTTGYEVRGYSSGWNKTARQTFIDERGTMPEWLFVVFEWDKAAGVIKIKHNAGAWATQSGVASDPVISNGNLYVGAYAVTAGSMETNPTKIDEMGLWNRALSDAEVAALYNSGAGMTYADILATGATPTPTPASGGRTQTGTLVIQKVIVGGDPAIDPDDFTFTLDNEAARFSEAGTDTYIRAVGMHIVHENAFPGFSTTYSGDCDASGSITVAQDVTRTCIITNTAVATPTPTPGSTPGSTPEPTPSISPEPWETTPGGILEGTDLREGDTVSAAGSSDPDVYIVNTAGYKRLFLNPIIFSFYGHLGGFSQVKTITPQVRDSFGTSGLFRNCETNDQAVYAVEVTGEDTGILHHVVLTGDQAVAQDPDFFKKVFCINTREFDWYTKGADYSSLSQVPVYSRK